MSNNLGSVQTGATATFEGKFISITKSINLGNREFTPIGIKSDFNTFSTFDGFNGNLLGNNNVIRGLRITDNQNEIIYTIGLIGVLGSKGEVENIILYDGHVNGYSYVGGVVGYNKGIIKQCQADIEVTGGGSFIGAITGYMQTGSIIGCINNGKCKSIMNRVGGIAGQISSGEINNCKNTGLITTDNSIAGGIVGYMQNGSITNCDNSVSITTSNQMASGIVGYMQNGTIIKCSNTGEIKAKTEASKGFAGGIVGEMQNGTISEVYNSGNIKIGDKASKVDIAGGIVGSIEGGSIEKAYNKGEIIIDIKNDGGSTGGVIGQKTGGTLSKTYFYNPSGSAINGIGTTTSGNTTPLIPVEKITGEVEPTTVNYNSLNEFLKNI